MPAKSPTGRLVNLTDRNSGTLIPLPFRPDRGDMSHSGEPALAAPSPSCHGPGRYAVGAWRRAEQVPVNHLRLGALAILVVTLVWRTWTVSMELDPGRLDLPDRGTADAPRRTRRPMNISIRLASAIGSGC